MHTYINVSLYMCVEYINNIDNVSAFICMHVYQKYI